MVDKKKPEVVNHKFAQPFCVAHFVTFSLVLGRVSVGLMVSLGLNPHPVFELCKEQAGVAEQLLILSNFMK